MGAACGGDRELPRAADPAAEIDPDELAALDLRAFEADERAREHLAAGRFPEALSAVRAVLEDPRGDPARILPLYLLGAEAARGAGHLTEVSRALEGAERVLAELGSSWPYHAAFEAAWLDVSARHAQDLGRPDDAARHLVRALELARAAGEHASVRSIELGLANLWLEAEQHEQLESHVAAALARTDAQREEGAHAALELCLATSLTVRGREDRAADRRAGELLEALVLSPSLSPRDAVRARLRLAEVVLRRDGPSACLDQLALLEVGLGKLGLGPASLERMTFAMLQAHAVRRSAGGLEPGATTELLVAARHRARAHFEAWLAAAAAAPMLRDGSGILHRGELRGFLAELLALEEAPSAGGGGARAGLNDLARVHALATRHRRAGRGAPARIDAGVLGLGPGVGMLVYLPATLGSRLFLVDEGGVLGFDLAPADVLARARDAFQRAFDPHGPRAAWEALGVELLDVLVPRAARDALAGRTEVVIVGLDLLRHIPFEVLPLEDGTPLGRRFATSYAPDLVTASRLAARAVPEHDERAPLVACLAAPHLGPPLVPIPLDRAGRARLAAGVPRQRRLTFEGRDATPANFARAATSGAELLHVLTHGAPLEDGRPGTGLALAAGVGAHVVLAPEQIEALERVPPLVVLSACRAGRGPARLGEAGLEGLVGALLERGAQVVLLPYEDVELEAVLRRIEVLQPLLLDERLSPAQALRRAQYGPDGAAQSALYHAVGIAHRPLRPAR